MAYTKEQWDEAKFLWELDKPLTYIVEKTGISKGQISKKSKAQEWKKETKGNELKPLIKGYDKEKETLEQKGNAIVSKLATMKDYEITLLNQVIEDETGNKSLLFSTANLSLIRKNQMLTKNTKTIITKEDYYEDGKKIMTKEIESEIPLSPNDYKSLDEGIEVNAKSLDIAPRFSNSQINVNTQNNQVQQIELNKEVVSQTLEAFNNEY